MYAGMYAGMRVYRHVELTLLGGTLVAHAVSIYHGQTVDLLYGGRHALIGLLDLSHGGLDGGICMKGTGILQALGSRLHVWTFFLLGTGVWLRLAIQVLCRMEEYLGTLTTAYRME